MESTDGQNTALQSLSPTAIVDHAMGVKGNRQTQWSPSVGLSRRQPTQTYRLMGKEIVLSQGECALSNTGWRTWAGSWLLAKYFEGTPLDLNTRVLDLSCGTGLAGIALACAGNEVVLCDMEINIPTVRANLEKNSQLLETSSEQAAATVVGYSWGAPLPTEMKQGFDVVLCGDLLYHVWSGRLHTEFIRTLDSLYRGGQAKPCIIFGFQVRSGRQEQQVLDAVASRLHLEQKEMSVDANCVLEETCFLNSETKYRLVCLQAPS